MKKPTSVPYADDRDISRRQASDDFWIRRIFKFAVLAVAIGVLLILASVFCIELVQNNQFRQSVVKLLRDNLVGIVVAGLAIIGITIKK